MKEMRCKECTYWLRDSSLPEEIGYCSAKRGISNKDDVCEVFKRKEPEPIAVKVYTY
ncbi:MAG: hypothetical protein NZ872_04770 [Archaeoglobaceae archaeon]|nr:hypothetical protein [Archaeoglobaceae archaeon]MDW8128513.1 hypothetical protein [Archaeoglobaceae archaeon]